MKNRICIVFCIIMFIISIFSTTVFAQETTEESASVEETSEQETEPERIDINSFKMPIIENQIYQGKPCKPTVKIDGLKENENYKIKYENNTKPGTAYISVEGIGDYCGSVQLSFEIVLDSVKNLKYDAVSEGIKLHWKKVVGADGYCIYRKDKKSASWKKVAQNQNDSCSWTDKKVSYGKEYFYTVSAFVKVDHSILESAYNENAIKVKVVLPSPKLKETVSKSSSVRIKWEKVKDVTKYYIYRKTKSTKWKKIASVKNTSYEDKTVKYEQKYLYTVKAVYKNIESKYDKNGLQGATLADSVTMKSIFIGSSGKSVVGWNKINHVDGYLIYRKTSNGKWQKVGDTSANKFSWSETGKNKQHSYVVAGYRLLNGKKVAGKIGVGITPTLEYGKEYVKNVTKTYLGTSGANRKMYSYTIGSGKNHLVITMAIHGWEDVWARDGLMLVKTGNKLIVKASKDLAMLKKYNYSIIIVPMANPDGIYDGYTCNGPGRCTTYRYNRKGKLIRGGIDLNRSFPAGFKEKYNSRNYTGNQSLMAKEAVVLKKFVDSNKGKGKNVYIDAHGWLNQMITVNGNRGKLYLAFRKYFMRTRPASFGRGMGYIAGYAQRVGYQAALFEFPYVNSVKNFERGNYSGKFINSIYRIMETIH